MTIEPTNLIEIRGIIKNAPRRPQLLGSNEKGLFGFARQETDEIPFDQPPDIFIPGSICTKYGISNDCVGEEWTFVCRPPERDDRGPVAVSARREVPDEMVGDLELDDVDRLLLESLWQLRNVVTVLSSQINAMARRLPAGKD